MAGDFNYGNVSLLAHLVAASGASTPDTSNKGKLISLQGGASIVADSDFIGGFALSVSGNGACADTPGVADLAFANGDFCVECAFKTTDIAGGLIDGFVAGSTTSWQLYLEAGKLSWYAGNTKILGSTSTVNTGVKVNVAVTRAAGTLRIFINGALEASAADSTVYTFAATKLSLGRQVSGSPSAASDLIGKIGEVRITKGAVASGAARYTANYPVATSAFPDFGPLTPTTWNPSDKAAGLTLSNGNLTSVGFASASCRSIFSASAGKWYFEITRTAGADILAGVGRANASLATYVGGDANGWSAYSWDGSKYNNNVNAAYAAVATAVGGTIGVKLDLDAGTLSFVIGGVDRGVAFTGIAGPIFAMPGNASPSGSSTLTANFGASAFAYPVPAGYNPGFGPPMTSISGVVSDAAGAPAARTVRAYVRSTGAMVGSTVSDASTGAYSMTVATTEECSVICLDDAAGTLLNDLILRAVPV